MVNVILIIQNYWAVVMQALACVFCLSDTVPVNADDVQVAVLFTQVDKSTVTFSFPVSTY